jgi:hypothetical protein
MHKCCLRCKHGTLEPYNSLRVGLGTRSGVRCSRASGVTHMCGVTLAHWVDPYIACSLSTAAQMYCRHARCREFELPPSLCDDQEQEGQ